MYKNYNNMKNNSDDLSSIFNEIITSEVGLAISKSEVAYIGDKASISALVCIMLRHLREDGVLNDADIDLIVKKSRNTPEENKKELDNLLKNKLKSMFDNLNLEEK